MRKTFANLVAQLRARQELLERHVAWPRYPSYDEIAALIESGEIFDERYGKEL